MDAQGRTADVFAWQRSAIDSATTYTNGMLRLWSDAVKRWTDGNGGATPDAAAEPLERSAPAVDPGAAGLGADVWKRVLRSSRVYMRFAEFWFEFLKDMPALQGGRAPSGIYAHWADLYGKLLEQVVGVPAMGKRAEPAFPWAAFMPFTSDVWAKMGSGWVPALWAMPQQMVRLMTGERGGTAETVSLWGEVMSETIGKVFGVSAPGPAQPAEILQLTRDAYLRFCNAVPSIYRLFYSAGLEALKEFLARVRDVGLDAISSKQLREIYRMWWTANENAFLRLFQTPEFGRAVNEVMTQSLQIKERSENVAADWCRKASIPTRADFDEIAEALHELRRKVRRQEQEIEALHDQLAAPAPRRRSRA